MKDQGVNMQEVVMHTLDRVTTLNPHCYLLV